MTTPEKRKTALIDIGSNTIRTVVYAYVDDHYIKLYSERDYTSLLSYVRDGYLSEEGQVKLCETLKRMRRFCGLCGCDDPIAFSTAALRGTSNHAAVLRMVKAETGLSIVQLTAEEEMQCDYEGLRHTGVVQQGYAFDLGGGSCQIFRFHELGLAEGSSLPFGCLSLGNHFVRKGLFPDREETRAIRRFVHTALEERLPGFAEAAPEVVHAIGGSARAVLKALRLQAKKPIEDNHVTRKQLHAFAKAARKDEGAMVSLLRQAIPGRMSTLIPGVLAMETILEHLGSEAIEVSPAGVREGFLWTHA